MSFHPRHLLSSSPQYFWLGVDTLFVCPDQCFASRQEREALKIIPLKEIHKVQECKQRSVSLLPPVHTHKVSRL